MAYYPPGSTRLICRCKLASAVQKVWLPAPPQEQQLWSSAATAARALALSLVLEQLLRVCPGVKKVYVLVRPKRGVFPHERLQRLLAGPLFHLHQQGQVGKPSQCIIEALEGDILQPACGLSPEDQRRLHSEVDLVVHAAASIKFEDHIHQSLLHNYVATRHVADLAGEMSHAKALVHISTAYVNSHLPKGSLVHERIYPLSIPTTAQHRAQLTHAQVHEPPPKAAVRVADEADPAAELAARGPVPGTAGRPGSWHAELAGRLLSLPSDEPDVQAQRLLRHTGFPNAYCLTKHMAEALLAERHLKPCPVAIVRPSIIGSVALRPLPGYVGNKSGATGAALAIATGLAAYTCHQPKNPIDIVPADLVASAVLACAAEAMQGHLNSHASPSIVHVCTSDCHPITTAQFYTGILAYFARHPPPHRLALGRYPQYGGRNIVGAGWQLTCRNAAENVKFATVAAVLRVGGQGRAASQVLSGWKAWRTYNTPALDFNLRFEVSRLEHLEARLDPGERSDQLKLSWDPEVDSWEDYMAVYMGGLDRFCFKREPLAPAAPAQVRV
ncbi:hypothetical protein WJX72_003651 [[Myrmecia] bisecta]|uniref:Fatty acyl-CoA reductase n=1 Tax=[Myrmecia] bisecta TaxID=41462 RepID=A0AAW1Q183_9CHLO